MPGFLSSFVDSDRAGREQILRTMESAVQQMGTIGNLEDMRGRLRLEQQAAPGLRAATAAGTAATVQGTEIKGYQHQREVETNTALDNMLQDISKGDAKLSDILDLVRRGYGGTPDGKPGQPIPYGVVEKIMESVTELKDATASYAAIKEGVGTAFAQRDVATAGAVKAGAGAQTKLIPKQTEVEMMKIKEDKNRLYERIQGDSVRQEVTAALEQSNLTIAESQLAIAIANETREKGGIDKMVAEQLKMYTEQVKYKNAVAEIKLLEAKAGALGAPEDIAGIADKFGVDPTWLNYLTMLAKREILPYGMSLLENMEKATYAFTALGTKGITAGQMLAQVPGLSGVVPIHAGMSNEEAMGVLVTYMGTQKESLKRIGIDWDEIEASYIPPPTAEEPPPAVVEPTTKPATTLRGLLNEAKGK